MDAILQFTVTNQEMERTDEFIVVEGSENYLQAQFTCTTPDWDGMTKTGVFIDADGDAHPSLCAGNICEVPKEWLIKQKGFVGLIGSDGTTKITTKAVRVSIKEKGYTSGGEIEEEAQTYFDQLIAAFAEKYAEAEAQAKLSRRWAVGLDEEPETLEDNAKYYAGQAKNDAAQTQSDRNAVSELSEHVNTVAMQVDADKTEAGQYMEQAAASAANALRSEQAAKTSETAAREAMSGAEAAEGQAELFANQTAEDKSAVEAAKTMIIQMGQGVSDNKTSVEQTVSEFELEHQQAVADVNNAGQAQAERVEGAGDQAVKDINAAGTAQINAINAAGSEQKKAVEDAGQEALNNIGNGVDSSLTVSGKAADAAATGKAVDELKTDLVNLGIFKYTNSSDLISFIKSIYCPNLTGQIGVCTIVNDTDEIRINIYNVDDTGRYTSSTPLETFKFGKNEIGVIKCIGRSFNSIAQIDTVSLYQKILGTSGVTGYNSIFNQWVTYYNNMSQLTGEKAQQTANNAVVIGNNAMQKAQEAYIGANNALEKVDALAEVCVDTELSAIGTTGTKGGTSSETWRGFRTRIANVAPICAVDIIIGLSAESEVTLSILDTSLNIICRVTKTLPVGVDTYRFDLGGNYSIDGEELFVELFSNAKTITSKTVGNSASDYVTADNRTADKGNYFSNSTGETVYWNIIKNASIAKSYSMMFTTYTDKYVLHTHAYDGDVINPKEIYTVQDAFSVEESMPQTIYIDHMVKLSEHEDICFDKTKSDKYFICSNILALQSANVVKTDHTIILNGFKGGKSINIQQVSTKSNIGADNPIRLLQIGDSVGGAFGGNANRVDFYGANPAPYWGVAQKLFDLDGIKANDTSKYKMQTIGFRNRFNYSVVRDGVTHASREAFGEGRGGWQLIDYLYNSIQGETETDREPTSSNPINPFYDGSKVWTGLYADELNSAGVKFSLAHYLSAYRTHDDNGNILTVGSGTGTDIHADGTNDTNTGYIVQGNAYINTPTHILQENAFNDPDIDSFVRNTELFIKAVRNEFPNMFIGIVFNDASFGYFSEYYNEYSMDGFMNGYGNSLHEKQYDRYNKLSDMISGLGDAKVFLLPTMFIQPTLNGCHTIDAVNADGSIVKYVGNSGTYHPNNVAHSAWGSQLYAWLKYTQTLV